MGGGQATTESKGSPDRPGGQLEAKAGSGLLWPGPTEHARHLQKRRWNAASGQVAERW